MSGLEELFVQHPLPWRADCTLDEFEAGAIVWDANENVVWEADDGTAQRAGRGALERSDILLAHAIAALPDLLASQPELIRELKVWRDMYGRPKTVPYIRVDLIMKDARAALVKAGVKEQGDV